VNDPGRIQIGATVRILQPDYVAGRIGVVISREELLDGQTTGRWIVQVEQEEMLLSLLPQDFELLD
jgi:hypothetical protein